MSKEFIKREKSQTIFEQRVKRALSNRHISNGINSNEIAKLKDIKKESQIAALSATPEQRVINRKGGKRSAFRPLSVPPPMFVEAFTPPPHIVLPTPEWFETTEPVDVSIIIPLFRSKQVIEEQIKNWDLSDDGLTKEIIYVDDTCPDRSHAQVLKSWQDKKHLLKNKIGKIIINEKNAGFGHSCNVGAQHAKGKYLIFLNADTIVTHNWVRPMFDKLEQDSSIGIVGNMHLKHLNGKVTIDSAGSEWSWRTSSFEHVGRHIYNGNSLSHPFVLTDIPHDLLVEGEREMVTGCCFMIPKSLFDEVEGFDTDYRIGYWEDSDLNMKVKWNGKRIYYVPESRIYHRVAHSGQAGHPYQGHNKDRFFKKWVNNGIIDSFVNAKRAFKLNTVLITRNSAHGDVLVASSVAAAIKKQHPDCRIYFQTGLPAVVKNHPFIDEVVSSNISLNCDAKYNLDLAYENRPKVHMLKAYADAAGVKREDCKLYIKTEPFGGLPKKYIVISSGRTAWVGRNWYANKFNTVAGFLKDKGYFLVNVGNSNDNHLSNVAVDLRGKTNIYQLASVIQNASMFIGIDSFPMWIAQTFNIPGVCFFGCVDPALRLINGNMQAVNASDLLCIGCHHEQKVPCIGTSVCKMGHTHCEDIGEDVFIQKVLDVMKVYKI